MTDEEWDEWDDWDAVGSFQSEAGRAVPAGIAIFIWVIILVFVYY